MIFGLVNFLMLSVISCAFASKVSKIMTKEGIGRWEMGRGKR